MDQMDDLGIEPNPPLIAVISRGQPVMTSGRYATAEMDANPSPALP